VSRKASYRRGLGYGAASYVASGALSVVSGIVIARVYGIRVVGEFALVSAPIQAVWFLSTVRERPAFIREVTMLQLRAPRITGLFVAVFSFSLVLTTAVAVLGLIVTYFVFAGPIEHPELFMPAAVSVGGYVVLTNTNFNLDGVFAAFRGGQPLFFIRLHEQLGFTVFAIAAGVASTSVWGLVLATIGAALTTLVHRLVSIRPYMRMWVSRREIRKGFDTLPDILRFGLKSTPGAMADGVSGACGVWILGATSSVTAVGAYSRAQLIAARLWVGMRINEMLFPTLLERRHSGDHAGFSRALVDSIRYTAVILLLPAAAMGGDAEGVLGLFGPGFSSASDALIVFLLVPMLGASSSFLRHTLYALDAPTKSSVAGLLRMAITLAATVPLTIWLGPVGPALGLVIGYVADLGYVVAATRRAFEESPWRLWRAQEVGALIVAYGAGFGAARLTTSAIEGSASVLPALSVGCVAYCAVFFLLGGLNRRDRDRIVELKRALRQRRTERTAAAR
jgi:O-antigen/teichoic acid export membrane protein